MIIKKLELVNFQVIKEFNAEFDGNVYFITGDNELGKSTLLKAIGALLTGERDEVLRKGETKGFAKMIVGDDGEEYEVSLSFSEKNPRGTLSIKQKTTGMQSNNVSMLQRIFGYQDFDAVEFSRWSETAEGRRKQIEVVKNLLPVEVRERIEAIDAELISLKEERTGANRDVKTFTTIFEQAEKSIDPAKLKEFEDAHPIDVAQLLAQQTQAIQLREKAKTISQKREERISQLAEIPSRKEAIDAQWEKAKIRIAESKKQALEAYQKAITELDAEFEGWNVAHAKEIEALELEAKDLQERKANADMWLADYESKMENFDSLETAIEKANEHNSTLAIIGEYRSKRDALNNAKLKQSEIIDTIAERLTERENLIAGAKLPIKGLSFSEDGLELNGVPFVAGKVSDSQIMEIAAKLVIISNPKVKVFRIARGESLGSARLENIIAIAKKYGYQGFIEQVQRGQNEMIIHEYEEK